MIKFILIFLLLIQTALANKIFYTKGLVGLKRKGKVYKAKKGISLKTDDIIQTGAKSIAIIEYGGKSKIKVDPSSQLKFKDFYENGDKKKKRSLLNLLRGSLIMNFKRDRKNKDVHIEMKNIAVGVRGTRFMVSTESKTDSNSYVAVKNGRVNVYNFYKNDYEPIRGSRAVVIEKGGKLTKPHKFQWLNKLNWGIKSSSTGSLFNSPQLKSLRLQEIENLLDKLRLREPKIISDSLMKKWKKIQDDSLKFKSPVKTLKKEVRSQKNRIKKKIDRKIRKKLKPKDGFLKEAIKKSF